MRGSRQPASSDSISAGPTLVLDSGGGYIRAGFASDAEPRAIEPNCSAIAAKGKSKNRSFVFGDAVRDSPSYTIHRPTQRGLLLDLEQQTAIWEDVLSRPCFSKFNPNECNVMLTQATFQPPGVVNEVLETLYETFGFKSATVVPSSEVAPFSPGLRTKLNATNPCYTVLDVGFSGCVALPCVEDIPISRSSRRSGIGGRVLTNILGERFRLRHYDLSSNWLLQEDILNKVCEFSLNFDDEMRSGFREVPAMTYTLPDYQNTFRGSVEVNLELDSPSGAPRVSAPARPTTSDGSSDSQSMVLRAERVTVPEAIFSPKDHGIQSPGIAELVQQAILSVEDQDLRPHLGQVVVCGGLARMPKFCRRLSIELRQLLPETWPVTVFAESEPELSVWRGAAHLARNPDFCRAQFCSRKAWMEMGAAPANIKIAAVSAASQVKAAATAPRNKVATPSSPGGLRKAKKLKV